MLPNRDAAAVDGPTDACPRCGALFACGVASGRCWCSELPPLAPLPDGLPPSCLCPACLRELAASGAPIRHG
ncbi:MAG: cysteine-rich CWC family protein [Burkholderiaceae bacterium]|nr:cysteine-rich CWC family protein [Burkholderiaceae bacterium]